MSDIEEQSRAATTEVNVKKRKKNLDQEKSKSNKGAKKRNETAKDRLLKWNSYLSNKNYGIWIQCIKCHKWRRTVEYREDHEVPKSWCCSNMSGTNGKGCDEPENTESIQFAPVPFIPGTIVWAKVKGYPWWPGMIEIEPDTEEYYWIDQKTGTCFYNVTFLDDKVTRAWVSAFFVRSFVDRPQRTYLIENQMPLVAAAEAKGKQAMEMSLEERFQNFSFAHKYKGRWGPPLKSEDSDDCEDEEILTQKLLKELEDIESVGSPDSDNEFISSSKIKKKKRDMNKTKLLIETQAVKETKPTSENASSETKRDKVKTLKVKNKKTDKSNNWEQKTSDAKENEVETSSTDSDKKLIENAKTMNEIKTKKKREKKVKDNLSCSTFKPPLKKSRNENNIDEVNQSSNNIDDKKEETKQCDNSDTKFSGTVKKASKNTKSKKVKESMKNVDIIVILEKDLKISSENEPLSAEENNKEDKKRGKKANKKKNLLDLASSKVQDKSNNYSKRTKSNNTSNIQKGKKSKSRKIDSSTENLPLSSEPTEILKFCPRQNTVTDTENKGNGSLETVEAKNETKEKKLREYNYILQLSDDDVDANKDKCSLAVEMNSQQSEAEDSDPFEAE